MAKVQKPNDRTERINVADFTLPGEHVVEGIPLAFWTPPEQIEKVKNLEVTKDDVFVASYPKTGTTVTQEIVWLIRHGADTETAKKSAVYERFPYLENTFPAETNGINLFNQLSPPKHLKTHLPWHLGPQKAILEEGVKTIYVMRNPKDTLVSYYYFYCSSTSFNFFPGTWADFFDLSTQSKLCYGDLLDHYLGWWEQRNLPNLLIVKYEDILRDPKTEIKRMASFLEKELTEEQIDTIHQATTFKAMKANPMTNYSALTEDFDFSISPFMRKGTVGDWKNHFTVNQNDVYNQILKTKLAGSGLSFQYTLSLDSTETY